LPKAGRWDARSAMSLPFRCVEDTIVKRTVPLMRLRGGKISEWTRQLLLVCCGSKAIRWHAMRVNCLQRQTRSSANVSGT
jgi:hypothetical protein